MSADRNRADEHADAAPGRPRRIGRRAVGRLGLPSVAVLVVLLGRHGGGWSSSSRHRRDDLPARARPLRHGQAGGHEGHRVLPRLRAPHLVVPPGRDRVRHQGHPRRRLRADHRDEQPRRGRPGRRGPHLPPEAATGAALVGGRRRLDHALHHRLPAVLRASSPGFGRGDTELATAGRSAPVSGPAPSRPGLQPGDRIVAVDGERRRHASGTTSDSRPRAPRRDGRARASCVDGRTRRTLTAAARPARPEHRRARSAILGVEPRATTMRSTPRASVEGVSEARQGRWARSCKASSRLGTLFSPERRSRSYGDSSPATTTPRRAQAATAGDRSAQLGGRHRAGRQRRRPSERHRQRAAPALRRSTSSSASST